MIDLLRQIKKDLANGAAVCSSNDVGWLVTEVERLRDEVKKWDGERDPNERRADYAELRTQLHTATGVAVDVPISMFGLVDMLIQQRDEAQRALTGCPETHPDRPDVRCTQDRHDNGHLYCRNSDLGLEWWTNSAGVTVTVHDVLGAIQLGRSKVRPAVPTGLATDSHPERRGRYHTLPPCEDDPEDQPELDTESPATATDPGVDAHTDVYRSLVAILENVTGFLDRMGRRYRADNPRMTSEMCRTAETHRDALDAAAASLRELIDGTGGG